MAQIIHLKCKYTIEGKICSDSDIQRYCFNILYEDNSVNVIIDPTDNSVESSCEFNIPDEIWTPFQNNLDGKDLPKKFKETLRHKASVTMKATKKVLGLIKYCFDCTTLNENLLSSDSIKIEWSLNKSEWKTFCKKNCVTINVRGGFNLNEKNVKVIQEYIDINFSPFFALRHLHRAMNETNTRYKWIDATTAAELAIKEFLVRKEPTIETILLEVPSPPLHKLYGSILQSYTKEGSPKLKEIQMGAQKRNELVHRPQDVIITTEEANIYVNDVKTAIYHLLHLLYPDDNFINSIFDSQKYTKAIKPKVKIK